MLELTWLIPALPLAGAILLVLAGPRMSARSVAVAGVGSVGLSAVVALAVLVGFRMAPPPGNAYDQVLWTWISTGGFNPQIAFHVDALALLMAVVVTFVGFLIHLYSAEFMAGDEGYSRFFAYMNLFVASMLILVLGNNLLLLFLGWEGVGLCSFLLIGFWYTEPANATAATKAFIVTRVGDTAMTIGLFVLFHSLGTLNIQEALIRAEQQWIPGSTVAIAAAALLLGGAVGKSAQLPLQTWLPDAMAGPTPTSALIHAATMVTAGVYLIARTHVLFTLAPPVQFAVAVIGAATLLLAGFSALMQWDIKRVLAYSTVSQIGYMFLALGVGAWPAAMFHFMTHAFFKALLFLAAGVVILALHHEHDMFRMGGLRKELPVAFWSFLIGGSALAGLPLITAGFYSKDLILWHSWASPMGGPWFWAAAMVGVVVTALYTYRQIFLVFFGDSKTPVHQRPGLPMRLPLYVLGILSLVGGFIYVPSLLRSVFPSALELHEVRGLTEAGIGIFAAAAFALGLLLAWVFYLRKPEYATAMAQSSAGQFFGRWWFSGWGFDWLYDRGVVRPVVALATANRRDLVDSIYGGLAAVNRELNRALALTQTGRLRWYAAGMVAGSILFLAIVLMT